MRTIVELPAEQIEALKRLGEATRLLRTELVRQAVAEYLARRQDPVDDEAFGLRGGRKPDALAHEDAVRAEWTR